MPINLNQRPEGRVTEFHAPFKAEGTDIRNAFGVIVGAGIDEVHASVFAAGPDLLEALRQSYDEIKAWRSGLNHRNMNKCKVGATFVFENVIKSAIAKAEGREG